MPKPHEVKLTREQMLQLAKDAALCAGAIRTPYAMTKRAIRSVMPAAKRILKLLKLEN